MKEGKWTARNKWFHENVLSMPFTLAWDTERFALFFRVNWIRRRTNQRILWNSKTKTEHGIMCCFSSVLSTEWFCIWLPNVCCLGVCQQQRSPGLTAPAQWATWSGIRAASWALPQRLTVKYLLRVFQQTHKKQGGTTPKTTGNNAGIWRSEHLAKSSQDLQDGHCAIRKSRQIFELEGLFFNIYRVRIFFLLWKENEHASHCRLWNRLHTQNLDNFSSFFSTA